MLAPCYTAGRIPAVGRRFESPIEPVALSSFCHMTAAIRMPRQGASQIWPWVMEPYQLIEVLERFRSARKFCKAAAENCRSALSRTLTRSPRAWLCPNGVHRIWCCRRRTHQLQLFQMRRMREHTGSSAALPQIPDGSSSTLEALIAIGVEHKQLRLSARSHLVAEHRIDTLIAEQYPLTIRQPALAISRRNVACRLKYGVPM